MKRALALAALTIAPLFTLAAAVPAPRQSGTTEAYIERYCASCHTKPSSSYGFQLSPAPLSDVRANAALWEKALLRLRTGTEPRLGATLTRPIPSETAEAVRWIETELDRNAAPYLPPAGVRRLNRTEYGNAIRSLLALDIDVTRLLPPDDTTLGFDNIADVLARSVPTQAYVEAASHISHLAIDASNTQPALREAIFVCRPAGTNEENCAREILATLARRAFKRPPAREEIRALLAVFQSGRNGKTFEQGIEAALGAILRDPKLLFRVEIEPGNVEPGQSYRITDFELASRLSFFLWSGPPDDELIRVAASDQLHIPEVLERETRRMLQDPRALALAQNFAGQWLGLRSLEQVAPSAAFYPQFDESLRQAMRKEVELFFASIVREDRSALQLLTADYTFLNERLALHYGIPGVTGDEFRRVEFNAAFDARRGLTGKAAFLTITSRTDRTSPVTRGKWVMTNLWGIRPADPPANVPPLKPRWTEPNPPSMREIMLSHRVNAACSTCHMQMDTIGLALEYFDGIGMSRRTNGTKPLDLSGELIDGTKIDGPADLVVALVGSGDQFVQTMTIKLWVYAFGRGVETRDMAAIRSITRSAARNDYRFSSVILGIVNNPAFQRNGKPDSPPR